MQASMVSSVGEIKRFLVVMQGIRLAVLILPSKSSKGEKSASLREYLKFADREEVKLEDSIKAWVEELAGAAGDVAPAEAAGALEAASPADAPPLLDVGSQAPAPSAVRPDERSEGVVGEPAE